MKFASTKVIAVAALAALPLLASAQLSANVSLTSNYKYRGQDQDLGKSSTFKPALQGGFDYAFSNGFYVGNWNSSVNWLTGNSLEMDFYGGYKGAISKDLGYDVGVLTYAYPGNSLGNTTELYGALTYGPFTGKYSHTVSSGYFGTGKATSDGRGTGYLNLAYAQEVTKGVTLKAAVGFTNFTSDSGGVDYADYSVGAAYDLGNGFSLSGAVVGATKKSSYAFLPSGKSVNQNALIVTLTKSM